MINVEHVTMQFRMTNDKIESLKETLIAFLSGKLKYEKFTVLDDVSFNVKKGEVVGIIGKNGAGKSTLLKIISGVLKPTSGKVTANGNIVPMLELGSGFDPELTGRENIYLNGAILGYSKEFLESKYDEIVAFSELGEFINMPIRNYSSGMMMRLAFSVATVVCPEILIVDEILAVGDEGIFRAVVPKIDAVNTVGCGDSMIAGFALGLSEGLSLEETLRRASAISAAAAMREETGFFVMEDMEALLPKIEIKRL